MAPKSKAISQLGGPAENGNGWRARVNIDGINADGPQRGTRAEAQDDLDRARQCASRNEMQKYLALLAKQVRTTRNRTLEAGVNAHGAVGNAATERVCDSGAARSTATERVCDNGGVASDIAAESVCDTGAARSTARDRVCENVGDIPSAASESAEMVDVVTSSCPQARDATRKRPAAIAESQLIASTRAPSIFAKSVKRPWFEDVANGDKFFESVANTARRRNGQFANLQANDFFVILGAATRCKVAAIGCVSGPAKNGMVDRGILYAKLLPERRKALDDEFGDSPSFNYVCFDKVYDARALNMSVSDLARLLGVPIKDWTWQGFNYLSRDASEPPALLARFLDENCPSHTHET